MLSSIEVYKQKINTYFKKIQKTNTIKLFGIFYCTNSFYFNRPNN